MVVAGFLFHLCSVALCVRVAVCCWASILVWWVCVTVGVWADPPHTDHPPSTDTKNPNSRSAQRRRRTRRRSRKALTKTTTTTTAGGGMMGARAAVVVVGGGGNGSGRGCRGGRRRRGIGRQSGGGRRSGAGRRRSGGGGGRRRRSRSARSRSRWRCVCLFLLFKGGDACFVCVGVLEGDDERAVPCVFHFFSHLPFLHPHIPPPPPCTNPSLVHSCPSYSQPIHPPTQTHKRSTAS